VLKNIFGNYRSKDKNQTVAGHMQDATFSLLAHRDQAGIAVYERAHCKTHRLAGICIEASGQL
jgi:hypothetical protein